ncbi:LapA family protein [candidate division KSB1 bacterium]|nr:LapA family protein [candidate division KSB1 bacterium]
MWILRSFVMVVMLLFLIYFGAENSTQTVYVKFIKWRSPEMQLWMVMYISFAVGVLVWFFTSVFKVWQLKNDIRKLNKESVVLKRELDNLRNISIEEDESQVGDLPEEIKIN